jgi:hypothetical protein
VGTWDLSQYREALGAIFSSRGMDNTRFDRWVNQTKREVESAFQFDALKVSQEYDTTIGERAYSLPDGFISIISINDQTNDRTLIRTDYENVETRKATPTGYPKYWARRGNSLVLSPTPDGVYTIEATMFIEPSELTDSTDVTLIPSYWDNAIYFLSAHYGWMELSDTEKAATWLERYVNYVRSRIRDEEWEGTSVSEPVRVVSDFRDLRRR